MSLPDPSTIPENSYLVVGYTPGEDYRFTGNKENYYFLSIEDPTVPTQHHFKIDFNNQEQFKTFCENYKGKFNVVIFDYSTLKLFSKDKLPLLFDTVKDGGYLVLDSNQPGQIVYNNVKPGENYKNYKKRKINIYKENIKAIFKDYTINEYQYRLTNPKETTLTGIIKDLLVAVYWPRVQTGSRPSGIINIFSEFVLIQKAPKCAAGGGGGGCTIMGGQRRLRRRISRRKIKKTHVKTSRRCARRNNH